MLCLLNLCFLPVFFFTHARPPMASCVLVDHRCQWLPSILPVKRVQVRCHRTANHLQVLNRTRIGFTILLRLSLRPTLASLKFITVIQSQNPTRNTTDKVQTFRILMNTAIDPAYTTKILIKESKRHSFNLMQNGGGCQAHVHGLRKVMSVTDHHLLHN